MSSCVECAAVFPRLQSSISDFLSALDIPVRFRPGPMGIMFFFLNIFRTLEAEHGIFSKGRRVDTFTHFSDAGAQANFHRAPWLTRTQPACHKRTGPPVDGLQAAARRVRLERPARDRRARPARGLLLQLRA